MSITFRPHHFLCALCFQGKGYSPEFISNFSNIMNHLNSSHVDDVVIEVVEYTDSICEPCPSKRGQCCDSQKKILRIDRAHADILQVNQGDKITWGEAKKRIGEFMTLEKFHEACSPCAWKKTGMCESVLSQFLK